MWIVFIIILVVVGLFAVWFNIWNHKDNKKKEQAKNNKQTFQAPSTKKSTEQEWMDLIRKNREQHEKEGLK